MFLMCKFSKINTFSIDQRYTAYKYFHKCERQFQSYLHDHFLQKTPFTLGRKFRSVRRSCFKLANIARMHAHAYAHLR